MDVRPIKTEADYRWALSEIERYFAHEPEPGSPDGDRFDVLSDLIEAYENRTVSIDAPSPIEAIHVVMEMRGLTPADLGEVLGSMARASEVLNGDRHLSLEMIQRLSTAWHLPADVLIGGVSTGQNAA